ncbi:MAG: dihydroorotase [Christensenellaceae bacterium]
MKYFEKLANNQKVIETIKSSGVDFSRFSVDLDNCYIFSGFCDVHVHFREPGFFYKETIKTGSMAAARGGYTSVVTMPNLNPVPDTLENLKAQLDIIDKDAVIGVYPLGSITKGEKGETLSDMEDMAPYVAGYSDDGRGVQSKVMMKSAMLKAKRLDKIIVAHCEDNSLLNGGYIHDGEYAKLNGHRGISSASEWKQVERDLELAKETGVKYHVCHVSTKESVEIIRQAKKDGVDVTCETAPHYLTMNDTMLQDDGRFKMNPPIRSESDRLALIEGLLDGTVDMIATDHAPHSLEEKSRGLKNSLMGVVGIETAFPILYTKLVKTNVVSLEKIIELLTVNPEKRFNIPSDNDYCVWDLGANYRIDGNKFLSMGRSTPFEGVSVYGECIATVKNGKIVYKKF